MIALVDDPRTTDRLSELKDEALEVVEGAGDACLVKWQWASAKGWIVLPGEYELTELRDERLALIRGRGVRELYGIKVLNFKHMPQFVVFSATAEDYREIQRNFAVVSFAVIPDDRSFLVLLTPEDYHLVAGPRVFLEDFFGCSVEVQRENYREYALDNPNQPILMKVHDAYASMSG